MLQVLLVDDPCAIDEDAVAAGQIDDADAILRIDLQIGVEPTDHRIIKVKVASRIASE